MGVFDKDDAIHRTAQKRFNTCLFLVHIPIGVDDQAEEIILLQLILNAADNRRSEGAEQVIHKMPTVFVWSVRRLRAIRLGW